MLEKCFKFCCGGLTEAEPLYWFTVGFVVIVAMLPVLVLKHVQWNYSPNKWQQQQWKGVARRKSSVSLILPHGDSVQDHVEIEMPQK